MEAVVLAEFRRRVAAVADGRLAKLVLFGSRARGEGDEHSDLDVLVLIEGLSAADRQAIVSVAADLMLEHELRVSPFVRDAGTFDRSTSLARAIESEGLAI